jgi:hypothetical protein
MTMDGDSSSPKGRWVRGDTATSLMNTLEGFVNTVSIILHVPNTTPCTQAVEMNNKDITAD